MMNHYEEPKMEVVDLTDVVRTADSDLAPFKSKDDESDYSDWI